MEGTAQMEKITVSDTVKVVTLAATIIIGATTTTLAVRANTAAVEQLTASLKDQGKRIDDLERWRIQSDAYAQGVSDAMKDKVAN